MSKCLQMAGWEKDGRFTSGKRKNQARFIRIGEVHECMSFLGEIKVLLSVWYYLILLSLMPEVGARTPQGVVFVNG